MEIKNFIDNCLLILTSLSNFVLKKLAFCSKTLIYTLSLKKIILTFNPDCFILFLK